MAIGYTIGTGSVTAMIVAGNNYGMELLWVLALSCFFSWILMEAYGRYSLVTGETALYGFRHHLKLGKIIAILIIIGISIGQWNSLVGILGISANIIFESTALFMPGVRDHSYLFILITAMIILAVMYLILWQGKYSHLEKVLIFFVTIMGLSFLISLFMVVPDPKQVINGLIPRIPDVPGGKMLVAAFVGTTMAAATFISRPLFIKGKNWTIANLRDQSRDAISAAILIFLISGSLMVIAAATLFGSGSTITKVMDMVHTLEPIAGRFAVSIFFVGTLGAGLSSIFPILMITPIMIADYQNGTLDVKSTQFRILAAVACLVAMTVPVFGFNPINAQIFTQVINVFVLPLVIIGIIVLLNNTKLMGKYKPGIAMNFGMGLALIFACLVSYTGILGIIGLT